MNGTGFGEKAPYTTEERQQILSDLKKLVDQQIVHTKEHSKPTYTTTAGAPGTGKSHFIENKYGLAAASAGVDAVYIDPDRVGLPCLTGYCDDLKQAKSGEAYAKW